MPTYEILQYYETVTHDVNGNLIVNSLGEPIPDVVIARSEIVQKSEHAARISRELFARLRKNIKSEPDE